jgi:hypothetical protein
VTISAIAVAQDKAAAAHALATDWHAPTAALETELQPGAVLKMFVCCVVMTARASLDESP